MLLAEPPRSRGDLNFPLLGFPVRVHPFFWLTSAILTLRQDTTPQELIIWVAVVFVSILFHELGHALAFRRYGQPSRIVLHSFGGLTIPDRGYVDSYGGYSPQSSRRLDGAANIFITFAGPLAGFLFAGLIAGGLWLAERRMTFGIGNLNFVFGRGEHLNPFTETNLFLLVYFLLYVNIMWGIINLFPVYPLDGGQIAREILQAVSGPRRGIQQSLMLSVATAVALAAAGLYLSGGRDILMPIFFGFLAYSSYATLQAYNRGYGP